MPQLNIRGADSFANGGASGKSFAGESSSLPLSGSWSQYGLLANKGLDTFGSAGWNFNGDSANNSCQLDFANTSNIGSSCQDLNPLGAFGFSQNRPPPSETGIATSAPADLSTLPSGKYDYGSTNLTVSAANIPDSRNITIITSGDITISGDVKTVSLNFAKLTDIPSVNIFAKNIYIVDSVKTIFANLVANGGTAYDCDQDRGPAGASLGETGICQNPLVFNGAIIASGSPRFQRTFGGEISGTESPMSTPSEIVNYTPNLFLVPFLNSTDNGGNNGVNWQTANEISLPARY
jgi:hypothetical protein